VSSVSKRRFSLRVVLSPDDPLLSEGEAEAIVRSVLVLGLRTRPDLSLETVQVEPEAEARAAYSLRLNLRMSNATVICWACGEEGLTTWKADSAPADVGFELWAWLRGHAQTHLGKEPN
jgi:hypothetical protein